MSMDFFKTVLSSIIRDSLHFFSLFPMDSHKILFWPSNGHYYCNLKYIDGELEKESIPLKRIWAAKEKNDPSYSKNEVPYKRISLSLLYHFFTAKIIIFNDRLPSWLYKRNGQAFINTWHGGGAYKKIDAVYKKMPKWRKIRAEQIWDATDYIISSCQRFTDVFRKDTGIPAHFLPIGMPRNDIFFDPQRMQTAADRVKKQYHIPGDRGIVLYAPTFRDNGMKLDLNVEELLQALEKRFHKPFVLFVRSHPHVAKDIFAQVAQPENAIDVSAYPDMQELLAAADVLITDYSSCMWDFSFTGRPCLIYANDLSSYRKERNFHTPIEEWPFPLAERNEELKQNIINFASPPVYRERLYDHHKALGSYENGTASRQMCRLIEDICYGKENGKPADGAGD